MASDNSRLADAISSGIVSLRAMADLRRHSNSTHPLFPHFWRLRLLPVLSVAPTQFSLFFENRFPVMILSVGFLQPVRWVRVW